VTAYRRLVPGLVWPLWVDRDVVRLLIRGIAQCRLVAIADLRTGHPSSHRNGSASGSGHL